MNLLAQGVAPAEQACKVLRQMLNDRNFEAKPAIGNHGRKVPAVMQELLGAAGKRVDAGEQRG